MSFNFQILADTIHVGILPSDELLPTTDSQPIEVGDVINAWVMYTRRTAVPGTALHTLMSIMPTILDKAIPSVTGFQLVESDLDVPDPDELVITNIGGDDYYILDTEPLDYGLLTATLHRVSDFHELWDNASDDTGAINSELVSQFILGAAAGALSGATQTLKPAQSPMPVQKATPTPRAVGTASPATKPVDSPTTNVNSQGVSFAPGFFGTPADVANRKSDAGVARDALQNLLNK